MPEPKPNFNPQPKISQQEIDRINTKLDTINNIEITHLFKPISKILEKGIKEKIQNCEYDLLIGEDASGRIPALVFKDILQKVYERNKKEQPQLLFMAGTRFQSWDPDVLLKFKEHVSTHAKDKKKALVVTELIGHGHSIISILDALQNNGISYDIAACAQLDNDPVHYSEEIKDHLFAGSHGKPEIFNKPELSGVKKNYGDVLSSHANKHIPNVQLIGKAIGEKTVYDHEKINGAREDVHKLAEILFEENFK
ncbi:MAG: hypothetical protein AAB477_01135 [Patescibacteria group bacterium]